MPYRLWLLLARAGTVTRWRLAGEAQTRREADRLAALIRAGVGATAELQVEFRPSIVEGVK